MPHPTGPTNQRTRKLIAELRKSKEKLCVDVARRLEKSSRAKKPVNLQRISKYANEHVVVPGKVLGTGELSKPVHVYALSFSKQAKLKIEKANGKALPINSLLKEKVKARLIV